MENAGEIVKRGAASSFMSIGLHNTGNLRVEQGLLDLGDFSTNTGTIFVAAGARLELSRFYHGSTGRITGAGYVRMLLSVLDGAYEVTGTTEIGGQNSALFNAPIRSTGAWLITSSSATFNGTTTELLGPVTLRGGQLILNSPGETLLPNLRLEVNPFCGENRLGGSGQLVFRQDPNLATTLTIQDALRVRFEAPVNFTTNLIVQESARVDLLANSRWTGSLLQGNIYLATNVVLELASTNATTLRLPFPQEGILRKTSTNSLSLSSHDDISGNANRVINRSRIGLLAGSISIRGLNGGFFIQEAGALHLAAGTGLTPDAFYLRGGELTSSGQIFVIFDSINRGCQLAAVVSPGEPYGVLNFTGPGFPNWMTGSRTIIDIGGTTPGVNQDQIIVERTLNITGGTLEIRTAAGFVPALGQEFTILTGSGRTGTFPTVTGLEIGNGRRFRVIYEAQAIKLRVEGP